jgi:hypothetical protein
MSRRWILAVPAVLGGLGCGEEELPGQYWDIGVQATENECTANGIGYNEQFEYRVLIDGNDATIAVGEDVFAFGTLDGCNLSYTSIVWTSYPDQYEVKWQISGEAQVNVGGAGGCVEGGSDWVGTERINFNASAHPAIQPGCLYTMDVTGTWVRNVEE